MPVGGKQLLHFPRYFLGTDVRYLSKVEVAPVGAAGCLPLPTRRQSPSKATPCSTVQKELGIAVSSQRVPRGSRGALLRNLAGSKAIKAPQRSLGGNLQCQGRTERSRLCLAVASLDQKSSLQEHGVVTCQAGLGWLAEGFTTNPSIGQ